MEILVLNSQGLFEGWVSLFSFDGEFKGRGEPLSPHRDRRRDLSVCEGERKKEVLSGSLFGLVCAVRESNRLRFPLCVCVGAHRSGVICRGGPLHHGVSGRETPYPPEEQQK